MNTKAIMSAGTASHVGKSWTARKRKQLPAGGMEAISVKALLLLCTLAGMLYPADAHRIVSTAPSITETLFALGLGDRVVGVTNYCHYPPAADTKPRIGTYLQPDIETIVALHPDLVVVEHMPNRLPQELDRLHIREIVVDHISIGDVFRSNEVIGQAAGVPEAAKKLNNELKSGLDAIRAKTAGRPRPKLLFVVGQIPGQLQGIVAAGPGSYFDEIMTIVGAENAFSDAKAAYSRISLEEIIRRQPDFIIEMVAHDDPDKGALIRAWTPRKELRAVRENHVIAVPSELFVVPGPRVVEAATYLGRLIHPESGL